MMGLPSDPNFEVTSWAPVGAALVCVELAYRAARRAGLDEAQAVAFLVWASSSAPAQARADAEHPTVPQVDLWGKLRQLGVL